MARKILFCPKRTKQTEIQNLHNKKGGILKMVNQELMEILRKIFETKPEKSTIVLKDKCSECGCETIINITPTSGGFGLEGGALFECSPDGYLVKYPDCYKTYSEIDDSCDSQNANVSSLNKVSEEGSDLIIE